MRKTLLALAALAGSALALATTAAGGAAAPTATSCAKADLNLVKDGVLSIGTDNPAYPPWFVDGDPGNGKGFEGAVAQAVWERMGYTRGEIPMLDVHGISVSGGSFPAEIWRRFMSPALEPKPPLEFREPSQPAVFTTWERGPNALSYDPYYVAPETTTTETTGTDGGGSGDVGGKDGTAKADGAPAGAGR